MTLDEALKTVQDHLERGNKARRLLVDVEAMRNAQRQYFKDRTQTNLVHSKQLEKRVDDGLAELRRIPHAD